MILLIRPCPSDSVGIPELEVEDLEVRLEYSESCRDLYLLVSNIDAQRATVTYIGEPYPIEPDGAPDDPKDCCP